MSNHYDQIDDDFYLRTDDGWLQYPRIIGEDIEIVFDPPDMPSILVFTRSISESAENALPRAESFLKELGINAEILGLNRRTSDFKGKDFARMYQCIMWYIHIKEKIPSDMFAYRVMLDEKPKRGKVFTLPTKCTKETRSIIRSRSERMSKLYRWS